MFRAFVPFVLISLCGFCSPGAAAPPDTLKLGEDYKGEVSAEPKTALTVTGWHTAVIPIALKEGQGITLTVTAPGKDRIVRVYLHNTKMMNLGHGEGTKTAQFKFEEVSATGTYMIVVASPQPGGFTLRATSLTDDELDIKTLEERLTQLKKEVAAVEAKIKALKAKKKP